MSELYIVTAARGAGKTAFCRLLVKHARAAGMDVAGLLSPAVFENGIKTGILAENLRTNELRHLAQLSTLNDQPATFSLQLGNWFFDPFIIAWGNEILAGCLACDLFIVDEIGPLELLRGEGWSNALAALRESMYKIGIVVIRPELINNAQNIFPNAQIIAIESLDEFPRISEPPDHLSSKIFQTIHHWGKNSPIDC